MRQSEGAGSKVIKCPVCGAVFRSSINLEGQEGQGGLTCRRCKVDLSELILVHDQAIWYHRQALNLFQQGDYLAAEAENNRAIALHSHQADFHALAGKLSALQGDFRQAIAAWRKAIQIDPENEVAGNCLKIIDKLKR
jgi:tetratricopeptide (TPR) repeat protein